MLSILLELVHLLQWISPYQGMAAGKVLSQEIWVWRKKKRTRMLLKDAGNGMIFMQGSGKKRYQKFLSFCGVAFECTKLTEGSNN